ncbi:MAG: alpha/beta hydrolase [Abditibacteriaceae bacterium]
MKVFSDLIYRQTPQRSLRLDLRVPNTENPPLVMYIPMGGMRVCEKENVPLELVEQGFALASIECRVRSEAIAPAQIYDCQAAVRWLRAHASEYCYDSVNIAAWGSSAGGMLAALLATSGNSFSLLEQDCEYPEVSCAVQAAVDACGAPHSLDYFARPDVQQRFPGVTETLRLYLGGAVEECLELAHLVSPSAYISPACPAILIIQGEEDNVVPPEETVFFHQLLLQAGVDAELILLPNVGHDWDEKLTEPNINRFLKRVLMKQ